MTEGSNVSLSLGNYNSKFRTLALYSNASASKSSTYSIQFVFATQTSCRLSLTPLAHEMKFIAKLSF